jgi:hypothetical protein
MLDQAQSAAELATNLRAAGFTQLYFHWREWWRLQHSYAHAYALTVEKQRLLTEFFRTQTQTVFTRASYDDAWQNEFRAANPALIFPPSAASVPQATLVELR